jgi:NAD(P)-dependent dehydrogenase (short-subunit alcohol dehydrogenase family)
MGVTNDIAEAIVYLASDKAAFMAGSEMVVDGGPTAQ